MSARAYTLLIRYGVAHAMPRCRLDAFLRPSVISLLLMLPRLRYARHDIYARMRAPLYARAEEMCVMARERAMSAMMPESAAQFRRHIYLRYRRRRFRRCRRRHMSPSCLPCHELRRRCAMLRR